MRLVNLSHGDWLILAAYLCVACLTALPVSPFLALLVVVPLMFGIGYVLQRVLLNHVSVQAAERRGLSPVMGTMLPLLVTFGLSIVLSQGMLLAFSADAATIRNDLSFSAIPLTADLSVSTLRFGFFLAAAALIGSLAFWMRTTHIGRAIRAASDDPEIAALMGMRTPHIYAIASGLSLASGAIAGFMIGMSRSFQPFDGPPFLLTAFGVVIIGGLGSLGGCFVGGIALGVVQVLAGTYFGPAAQQIAGYLFILLVLAVRPQGLFAR
jgi:branched-chain amino acid transport system permease protein